MATNETKKSKLIFAPGEPSTDTHNPKSSSTDGTKEKQHQQQAAQFHVGTLTKKDLDPDPFVQFHKWFSDPALKGQVPETVTLSTAELPSGKVNSRMVYLKELDDTGFVIYSNWGTSRKARDIQSNPYASLCFWWKPLERQVRISGPAHRLTSAESQIYYDTRARGSRIGAWASQQSQILKPLPLSSSTAHHGLQNENNNNINEADNDDDGRNELEVQVSTITQRFADTDTIPVPDFWGGLRVVPETIEFWQGRESRLHDRFEYVRENIEEQKWEVRRLSP